MPINSMSGKKWRGGKELLYKHPHKGPEVDEKPAFQQLQHSVLTAVQGSKPAQPMNMKVRIEDGVVHSPYPSIEIPVCSFYDLVREKLLKNPDKTALVDDVVKRTRAEVLTQMQRYAVGFRKHGVHPGDRVCVHLKNNVENFIAMFGCVLAGATTILAKVSLTEGELRYQAQDSDSTHILTDEEYTENVSKATTGLGMKGHFCMGHAAGFVSASMFSSLDEQQFGDSMVTDPQNTVLAVCYTSGSTGMPKAAEMTHYNYVCSYYCNRLQMPWGDDDVLLGNCPIMHQSGMLYTFLAVLEGATCVVAPVGMGPLEIMDVIEKYKVTAAIFFPAQLQAVVREMQRTGRGLPTLRRVAMGGSVVSTSVAETARKTFAGIEIMLNMYGMTESAGIILSQPKNGTPLIGSDVGVPATMTEVKVVDVGTGQKLGPHQTGEICFRSAYMVKSYYKRPKETAELFDTEGWCKSGDCGYYDEDGRFYIVDRLKQMIKCMGEQVVPAELEELLLREHRSEVAEVSVVGLPHSEFGEAPAAAVVLTEEGSRRHRQRVADAIKATVERNLAVQKHLYGGVFFVDSLPKTETSKIDRPALARALLEVEKTVTK